MKFPPPPLFQTLGIVARELRADEVPLLQALFDANPEYFVAINGRRADADEAQREFDELPPPHLGFTRRWLTGLFDRTDVLQGVAIVVSDLSAPAVWHIALYLFATRLHGSGTAREVYAALEDWVTRSGAQWLRLGVVAGNARAERFWHDRGFREVRVRDGVDTGGRTNRVRVLAKPLGAKGLDDYLALVARDRPDSPLP